MGAAAAGRSDVIGTPGQPFMLPAYHIMPPPQALGMPTSAHPWPCCWMGPKIAVGDKDDDEDEEDYEESAAPGKASSSWLASKTTSARGLSSHRDSDVDGPGTTHGLGPTRSKDVSGCIGWDQIATELAPWPPV